MLQLLKNIKRLFSESKTIDKESKTIGLIVKSLYYCLFRSKLILAHSKSSIVGVENIKVNGVLRLGVDYVGFMHKSDTTFLNINGKLILDSTYSIGRGCRFDIREGAVVKIGKGGYITANSTFIIMHELIIGENCSISWDCQFLDDDFHTICYERQKQSAHGITLGDNIWVGSGVKIYKGTVIPNGCVIASNSVVKGIFEEENCLIAGHPAKVVRNNVTWH